MESLRPRAAAPIRATIDWPRLINRCLVGMAAVLGAVQVVRQALGPQYGLDFRGGTWAAGWALLHGRSPFVPSLTPAYLLAHSNSFITPPPLAIVGAPFSWLGFVPAVIAFNLACLAALLCTLWILDVRDVGFVVLVLGSFPFISSIDLGQPDGLFALGAAIAWRWRDSDRGALGAGAIIGAKLLAWPLVLWFLVTGRRRQAVIAAGAAAALLLASWALVGFAGLTTYPQLLAADVRAFDPFSHSFLTALLLSGVPSGWASPIAVAIAVALAAAVVWAGRRSDLAWFTGALTLGIMSSPIVWQHYFLLLFVALAATRRLRDPLVWLLAAALWLSPRETPATTVQAWLIPVIAGAMALRIAALSRTPAADVQTSSLPHDALAPALS